jgi:hypothetical protein
MKAPSGCRTQRDVSQDVSHKHVTVALIPTSTSAITISPDVLAIRGKSNFLLRALIHS